MEEIWKVIKEFKSNSGQHVEGDKLYVSNRGRIKLNDDILDFGKGLYVDKSEIRIVGCSYGKYRNLYRLIYHLFKDDDIKFGCNYNIHHIDYNHLNNDVDNLLQCSSSEHTTIHGKDQRTGKIEILRKYNSIICDLEDKKEEFIQSSKQYYKDRVKSIKETIKKEQKEQKLKEKEELRQEQLKQKQIERENKLKTGKYGIDKNGHLYSLEVLDKLKKSRIGLKASEYTKEKQRRSIRNLWTDDDYRNKVTNSVKEHYAKLHSEM